MNYVHKDEMLSLLHSLIKARDWLSIIAFDPLVIVESLDFDDVLRLTYNMRWAPDGDDEEELLDFSLRLLYQLKAMRSARWESDWKHEALLGHICDLAMRWDEKYYAYRRAEKKLSHIPTHLAVRLAGCNSAPDPELITKDGAIQLLEQALKEAPYPYIDLLRLLRSFYISRRETARVNQLTALMELVGENGKETPDILPSCVDEDFDYTVPSNTEAIPDLLFSTETPSTDQIRRYVKDNAWKELCSCNPRKLVRALSFSESIHLAMSLLKKDEQCQQYAVRLLYSQRLFNFSQWITDWRFSALLGFACEITGKYDEQFAAYHAAAKTPKPIPPGLAIAVAKCSLNSDSPVTYDEAISLLQEALKEHKYIDGLEILAHIYASKGDGNNERKIRQMLADVGSKGQRSPSILPEGSSVS